MFKVSQLIGVKIYVEKQARRPKKDAVPAPKLSKLGKVHMAVFSSDGKDLVGLLVHRPDVVGMVKREDAFVAWDSFEPYEKGLKVTRRDDGMDDAARKRLGVDWDACIMWTGMDAKTVGGKKLGYINDVEFSEKTGKVSRFFIGDGGVSRAIVGSFEVPPSLVKGYSNGYMILSDEAANLELGGGLAAKAGEGYAAAKVKGAQFNKKTTAATVEAIDKGSFALGKAIGKAKRAIEEAAAPEEEIPNPPQVEAANVTVSAPVATLADPAADDGPQRTFSAKDPAKATADAPVKKPAVKKPAAAAKKPAGQASAKPKAKTAAAKPKSSGDAGAKAAKAVGKQIGAMGKMFSSFKEEFDKASK